MSVILIQTNKEDQTADLVEKEFQRRGTDYLRLNTEAFGTNFWIDFLVNAKSPEVLIYTKEREIRGNEVKAVWYRRPLKPQPSSELTDVDGRQFASEELKSLLDGALYSLDCFWVSHPYKIRAAGHKPHQLKVALSLGFNIPKTCISMNPELIRLFYNTQKTSGKRVIGKLVSKGPPMVDNPTEQYIVHTNLLDDQDFRVDSELAICPATYQEYIEKKFELRITVVGDQVFACEIHSQATERTLVDWRRYDFPNTPYLIHNLDPDLEQKCLAIIQYYGLEFSTIDLVVNPEGKVLFLEMNPNGQWGWIEELTGLPITEAVSDLLSRQE